MRERAGLEIDGASTYDVKRDKAPRHDDNWQPQKLLDRPPPRSYPSALGVVAEDKVEMPDSELYPNLVDAMESLTDAERAELDAKLARGSADVEAGRMVDASKLLAKLRARREAQRI